MAPSALASTDKLSLLSRGIFSDSPESKRIQTVAFALFGVAGALLAFCILYWVIKCAIRKRKAKIAYANRAGISGWYR
jgi:putative flippase GtrA